MGLFDSPFGIYEPLHSSYVYNYINKNSSHPGNLSYAFKVNEVGPRVADPNYINTTDRTQFVN